MKKIQTAAILFGIIITTTTAAQAADRIKLSGIIASQTDTLHHKVYKKHKKVVRQVSTRRAARMQMQLRQADKHLREEQKVQETQRELKKDTLHHN